MNEKVNHSTFRIFILLWLAGLIAVAVYIRVKGVNDYYFSEDELLHIWIAKAGSIKQVLNFSLYETHPPILYIFLHYWLKISAKVWFARSLSLVFGIMLIPIYYLIGKQLNGELTGLCSSALIAFSYGVIIQSYLVRHYSIFLFFISLSLYCYLIWCDSRKNPKLFWYALFCVLAALTHFSAIFAIFSIAAYETLTGYIRKYPLKQQITWAAVNAVIAIVSVSAYFIWTLNGTTLSAPYFHTSSWFQYVLIVLLNPLAAAVYVLPSLYIIPVIIFLLFLPLCRTDKKLHQFLVLLLIALGFSTFLVAIRHYYPAGTRHTIWVMPFVIAATGWIIANGIKGLFEKQFKFCELNTYGIYIAAIVIPLAGWALSDAGQRFNTEASEYQMKEKNWRAMSDYLETLDHKSVILAARDDAILMLSVYPYLGSDAFNKKAPPRLVPYKNTQVLFDPYNRRISTRETLLTLLLEAKNMDMMASIENIIFMKTVWDVFAKAPDSMSDLIECKGFERKIISFPDFSYSQADHTSGMEKKIAPVTFISIPVKVVFEQIVAENGKAHACLK